MVSEPIKQLADSFKNNPVYGDWSDYDGPRFVTNKITVSIGSFYERMRYAVDYQDEHVLRRAAIERIIRRLLLFTSTKDIGRAVLEDMVQGSYIDNNSVPENFADDIQNIIVKYYRLKELINGNGEGDIVWAYAAIEIELHLFPNDISERTFTAVFQNIIQYLKPKEEKYISPERFNLLVYIGARRALMRESHAALNYTLFKSMVPEWRDDLTVSDEVLQNVASRFSQLQNDIQELMTDPVQWKVASRLKNETIYYELLRDITKRHGADTDVVLNDDSRVATLVTSILEKVTTAHKSKVSQSATRAIIYILITKVVIGLAIELPYEYFILQEINYLALGINIIFFPILMILMTKTIRYPGQSDIEEVVQGFRTFIEGNVNEKQFVKVAPKSAAGQVGHFFFAAVFFFTTFFLIISTLQSLHFNPASIFLFLFFLCIVTYMGLRIRVKAQEWALEQEDDSFMGLLWFLFVLPITRTGRFVSEKLSSFNVFIFFFDFILETPFKLILGSFDSFVSYVKESRREGL